MGVHSRYYCTVLTVEYRVQYHKATTWRVNGYTILSGIVVCNVQIRVAEGLCVGGSVVVCGVWTDCGGIFRSGAEELYIGGIHSTTYNRRC